jgi:adenylate cyclase
MSPSELVSLLNEYLSEMTTIILAQGGIIDKFEGDAIMAEFGAPLALPDHADRAVRAGLMMLRRLGALRQQWAHRGLPPLHCRVGINTGRAIIGNMGSQQVFDYTVLGDAVNLASRLEGINKLYRTNLMISEFTYDQLSPHLFRVRVVDLVQVKGKSQAVKIFEVYGEGTDEVAPQDIGYYEAYSEAFAAYLSRNFAYAADQFARALSIRPDDPASQAIVARMQGLDPHGLPETWDGSIALTTK